MTPTILHADMDAFFVAVEVRDDPELAGRPVLVGGAGRRGVVAAASYEAREHGCHSAQPMTEARRRCPQAIVLAPRMDAYVEASRQVFDIFGQFSPLVEPLSIDEAFLDLTGTERLHGTPREAAEALRASVREQTQLTCSVGIASVKFIAKIASALDKPDGLTEVSPGSELAFLEPLPIAKLWGVGAKTEQALRQHGIRTIGDIRRAGAGALERWFGAHGAQLHRLSSAVDDRDVEPGREAKSLSHEDTFADDVIGVDALLAKLLSQSVRVADRLVTHGWRGRVVRIKIRDTTFRTESRQATLAQATHEARVIFETVGRLLESVQVDGRRFRLTGVAVADLQDQGPKGQLDLLQPEAGEARGEALQQVLSAVRQRYGHQALFPAEAGGDERPGSAGGVSNTVDEE